jgi:hypothetical protein
MFEIRPYLVVPTIQIGSVSPEFSPTVTIATAKNVTYGQLAISVASESQPANAQLRFSGTCKGNSYTRVADALLIPSVSRANLAVGVAANWHAVLA